MRFDSSGAEEPFPVPPIERTAPVANRYPPATYIILGVVLLFVVWIYFKLEKAPKSE